VVKSHEPARVVFIVRTGVNTTSVLAFRGMDRRRQGKPSLVSVVSTFLLKSLPVSEVKIEVVWHERSTNLYLSKQ
jgi:hypothetical protein